MSREMEFKNMAYRFAGALWDFHGVCPQCGNNKENHMPSCKKTYEKLKDPRQAEAIFDEAFPDIQ